MKFSGTSKFQKQASWLEFFFLFFSENCSHFRGKGRIGLCIPNAEHFFKRGNVFPEYPLLKHRHRIPAMRVSGWSKKLEVTALASSACQGFTFIHSQAVELVQAYIPRELVLITPIKWMHSPLFNIDKIPSNSGVPFSGGQLEKNIIFRAWREWYREHFLLPLLVETWPTPLIKSWFDGCLVSCVK